MRAWDRGLGVGGWMSLIAKKQNTDTAFKCDWDCMVQCLRYYSKIM